jgi:hypothetical protein
MVTAVFNPFTPEMLANPYPMYRALLDHNPVSWHEMMEMWVLAKFEDVDYILTEAKVSANRERARNRFAEMVAQQAENFGPFNRARTMLTSDPPEHTRLRRLVSKAFTPRAVEELRPRIQGIVDELLDEMEAKGSGEIVRDLAYPLPVIVIAEMLGVPAEDREDFKRWSDDVVATLGGPMVTPPVLEKARVAIEELAAYLMPIIQDRRTNPRNDLITGLVQAEESGQVLSEDEIFSTTILLLIAGNETTTNLVGNAMYALLTNRDQWEMLVAGPGMIVPAVEELLRFAGPVQATGRVLMEDIEVRGHQMKEGQIAFVLLAAANRDHDKWGPTADTLDLTRNPTDHLAFGDGIHFCLGAPLARAEAQIAIGSLARRFPKLEIASEPEWGGTFIIRGVKKMGLTW